MKNERLSLKEILKEMDPLETCYGSVEQLLSRYRTCPLCGSNLHFTHLTDFSHSITQEIAKCPECKVKVRDHMHKLQ